MSWAFIFWIVIAAVAVLFIVCLGVQNCPVCKFLASCPLKIRSWEKRWRGVLTALAVLIGGIWGWNQFGETQRAKRVDRTMEYILRYEQGPVADARHGISSALKDIEKHHLSLDAYQAAVDANIESGDIDEAKIDALVDFYEGLYVCASNNICDREAATSYFAGAESENFLDRFAKQICERRVRNLSYAKGLYWVANLGEPSKANCKGLGK